MTPTKSAPHLYVFDRNAVAYRDLGPSTFWERALSHLTCGAMTTSPPAGMPIIPGTQDQYEGPRSNPKKP